MSDCESKEMDESLRRPQRDSIQVECGMVGVRSYGASTLGHNPSYSYSQSQIVSLKR